MCVDRGGIIKSNKNIHDDTASQKQILRLETYEPLQVCNEHENFLQKTW